MELIPSGVELLNNFQTFYETLPYSQEPAIDCYLKPD
jgi:hypothetical protein